jgi:dTDP-4-dehydrorhamnose reductase
MKIIVLGNGNLATYIKRFFTLQNFIVEQYSRIDFDVTNFNNNYFFHKINENDVVINCIGILKPKIKSTGIKNTFIINSLFPNKIFKICKFKKANFIHICSDCVYDGKKGNYYEDFIPNANDVYGISKSLVTNGTIIRTSFIGKYGGLLKWVLDNKNNMISGYDNCIWNGVTALELSKFILDIINNNNFWNGVRHLHSLEKISKYKLCKIINKIYNLNITINKINANSIEGQPIDKILDRSLNTIHNIKLKNIEDQINELKIFD